MIKKIIITTVILLFSIFSFGQTTEPSTYQKKQATKYTDELLKVLSDVTADQEKLLYQMNLNISLQFDSLKKLELETVAYKTAARAIFKNKDKQLQKLLSINQFDEYAMMQAEKKEEYNKKRKEKDVQKIKTTDSITKQKIIVDSLKIK